MRRWIGVLALGVAAPLAAQDGALTLEPHQFRTYDGRAHATELGRLTVPENRTRPGGKTIQLAFVRLPSTAKTPGPPIVWLTGGPGVPGIAMARVPVYFALFERLRADGDVILLDQRGIGQSSPALDCAPTPTPDDAFANDQRWVAVFTAKARACAVAWRAKGVDLTGYTNDASADDVDDLRRALEAEKISLIGHSYGTALAEAVIRRHGDHVARAVLAAVEGPDELVASPRQWDAMLARIGMAGVPPEPTLPALFRRALDRLALEPARVEVQERDGSSRTIAVGPIGLQWLVRHGMTDARNYTVLPALFRTVAAGDDSLLAPRIAAMFNGFQGRSPMASAIDCSRGWTQARMAAARREAKGALFSAVNLQWTTDLCRDIDVQMGRPTDGPTSVVPVLFLSGELDANTPPANAERLRRRFHNGSHVVISNSGHEMLPSSEVQQLVADFLAGAPAVGRSVRFEPVRFLSVAEAKAAPVSQR